MSRGRPPLVDVTDIVNAVEQMNDPSKWVGRYYESNNEALSAYRQLTRADFEVHRKSAGDKWLVAARKNVRV